MCSYFTSTPPHLVPHVPEGHVWLRWTTTGSRTGGHSDGLRDGSRPAAGAGWDRAADAASAPPAVFGLSARRRPVLLPRVYAHFTLYF